MAKSAPRIHPSMACGPPTALTISGIVMNGPMPIMSIMLRAVALPRPMPRIRSGEEVSWGWGSGSMEVGSELQALRFSLLIS